MTAYFFTELSSILITDISRRRSDHLGDAVLFHIFRHVYTDNVILLAKNSLCQSLGKLCLANTGWSQEQERSDRTTRILQTDPATADCLGNCRNGFLLSDHSLMKDLLEMTQTFHLLFLKLLYRYLRPVSDHCGDLVLCHLKLLRTSVLLLLLTYLVNLVL